jgi:hypothetical protein
MNKIPWYDSAILRQQIAQLLIQLAALFGIATGTLDIEGTVGAIFAGASALVALWTFITRLRKPTPPITDEAVERTQALAKKQGGYVRAGMLALVLALGVPVAVSMHGCSGTVSAYKQVDNPAELAYVLAEHYAALVTQAADLRQKPGTPAAAIAAMQDADRRARPIIEKLPPLRTAYLQLKSTSTEAQLQAALDLAVTAIADLARAVSSAKGAK